MQVLNPISLTIKVMYKAQVINTLFSGTKLEEI